MIHRSGPRSALLVAGILAALQFPSARLIDDDLIQIGILEGLVDCCGQAPLGLYSFLDGDPVEVRRLQASGPLAWYTAPDLKIHFFRPLASLLIAADHAIFRRWAPGYRVQTTLWYLLCVGCLTCLVAAPGRDGTSGGPPVVHPGFRIAGLIFALSPLHWQTLAYTAARWVLIAATLSMVALILHVTWRERGWAPGRPLSGIAIVLSLMAGEASLAALAYLPAYEIAVNRDPLRGRMRALAPAAGLVFAYVVSYALLGYGSSGGEGYINPLSAPLLFLRDLPGRMLAMSGEVIVGSMARLWSLEGMRTRALLAGAAGIGCLAMLARLLMHRIPVDARRRCAWWGLGAAGSLIPLAGSPPDSRHLIIPWLGASVVISVILCEGWRGLKARRPEKGAWFPIPLMIILLVVHVVLPPWRWYTATRDLGGYRREFEVLARSDALVAADPSHARTIFLTPVPHLSLQGWFLRKAEGLSVPAGWWPLSGAPHEHVYRRTGPRTLELRLPGGSLLGSAEERGVRRRDRKIESGERFPLDGMTVHVLESDDVGPTRVEFIFDRVLEDASLRFIAAPRGSLRVMRPPAPGETLTLKY